MGTGAVWCGQSSRLEARGGSREGSGDGAACLPACQVGGVVGRLPHSPQVIDLQATCDGFLGAACQSATGSQALPHNCTARIGQTAPFATLFLVPAPAGHRPKRKAWSRALRSVILSAVPAKNQSEPALSVSVSLEASLKIVCPLPLSSKSEVVFAEQSSRKIVLRMLLLRFP